MSRSGIVNVRMVITEEKILSNIEKVQKLINPNSKKQIVQLDEDTYFFFRDYHSHVYYARSRHVNFPPFTYANSTLMYLFIYYYT